MAKKKKKRIVKHQTEYRYNEEDEKTIFEEILSFIGTFLICSVVIILITSFAVVTIV